MRLLCYSCMKLQWSRLVMCSVCISGDGSGRTFQCCGWITPSSSQPLSLTTSALQHSCCPACSIADTGVTALPVCHAHSVAGGGATSRGAPSLFLFLQRLGKICEPEVWTPPNRDRFGASALSMALSCASVILLEISKIAESFSPGATTGTAVVI